MPRPRPLLLALALCLAATGQVSAQEEESSHTDARLIEFYGNARNYRAVKREVLAWHKTTKNGCVAFASTALRKIGFDIPVAGTIDGFGVSRITFAFSAFLEGEGWRKTTRVETLEPGDLVFTTGYPDHVFVFHSWKNQQELVARIIDNKGFLGLRTMFPDKASSDAAFAYALGAPRLGDP